MQKIKWPYIIYKNEKIIFRDKCTHEYAWFELMSGRADRITMETGMAIKNLKASQKTELEDAKTYLLFNCDANTRFGLKYIEESIGTPTDLCKKIVGEYEIQLNNFVSVNNREPRLAENKKLKSFAWAKVHSER